MLGAKVYSYGCATALIGVSVWCLTHVGIGACIFAGLMAGLCVLSASD